MGTVYEFDEINGERLPDREMDRVYEKERGGGGLYKGEHRRAREFQWILERLSIVLF